MKNKLRLLYLISALALALSACGTTDAEKSEPTPEEDTPVTEVNENEVTDNSPTETEEPVEEDEVVSGTEDSTIDKDTTETEAGTDTATGSQNETETETDITAETTLVESDEQAFSMQVLPNYKLTSEEPGRDILYLESDDTVFMRIETMEAEEGTYDYLAENMLVVLEASSNGDKPTEVTNTELLPLNNALEDVQAYQVNTSDGTVTGILFKKDNLIIRLTIFDSTQSEHFNNFVQMGETVSSK